MPDLYVTPNGTFTATQADAARATRREGSKPGSWKKVEVPTKKSSLIDFLNNGWKAPEPEPTVAVKPPRTEKAGARWRVWGGLREKLFVASARADSAEEAKAIVAASLIAKLDPST